MPAIFEIGARPFAAMVEEAVIVVLRLQRLDFLLDEVVDAHQQIGDLLGNRKIHVLSSRFE